MSIKITRMPVEISLRERELTKMLSTFEQGRNFKSIDKERQLIRDAFPLVDIIYDANFGRFPFDPKHPELTMEQRRVITREWKRINDF